MRHRVAPSSTVTGMADAANPTLGWNVARDLSEILEYHFMLNALLAGSIVALTAGAVGWMMVVRREAFAGHTLSMMAFPGAAGAALLGVPAAWGYFVVCGAGAAAIGRLSGGRRSSWADQSAGIGTIQALALAIGFLIVSLYGGVLGDLDGLLFGNLLGVSDGEVVVLVVVAAVALVSLGVLGRPLLFASVDGDVAAARGVPVRVLSFAFVMLLGLAVAATSQITGVLLVFALLVAPAASAQALTVRPLASIILTVVLGLLIVWLGLGLAYFSIYPAGFFITAAAFAVYLLARVFSYLLARPRTDRSDFGEPLPRPGAVI
ncbi:MAG TPA: metal ABC transporter permease [Solirubrobacteraceae bacterium]|nr:metal ABC transporter permease [Solirubrobacteraceae bacterium]